MKNFQIAINMTDKTITVMDEKARRVTQLTYDINRCMPDFGASDYQVKLSLAQSLRDQLNADYNSTTQKILSVS